MTTLAADVSTALARVVAGDEQPAEVAAAFPDATYLAVADPVGVVAVVAPTAIALPNAAVLRRRAPPSPQRGDAARVGGGRIVIDELTVHPERWWDPVPRLGRVSARALAAGVDGVAAVVPAWPDPAEVAAPALAAHRRRLARALSPAGAASFALAGEPAEPAESAEPPEAAEPPEPTELGELTRRLVGLGAGLTPAGDDLLAATTAALALLGDALDAPGAVAAAGRLSAAVEPWLPGTTAVSAALLAQAAAGAVAAPAAAVLRALAGHADPRQAATALLATGHTSGHDLAVGLLLGARLALAHHAADVGA